MILNRRTFSVLDDLRTYASDRLEQYEMMRSLLDRLQEDRGFDEVYCRVIVSLNYALLLGYKDSQRFVHVHIHSHYADRYEVFFDFSGSTKDGTFYGDFVEVSSADVITKIKDYLSLSRVPRGMKPIDSI